MVLLRGHLALQSIRYFPCDSPVCMGDLNKDTSTSIVGVVSSKQKSFGFIRSHLPTDTFFHKSACEQYLFESLKVGDAVSFQMDKASQPGKRVAAHVTSSTQQPLLEHVDPTELYGRVVKPPVTPAAGILRCVPRPGKVQHLTFTPSDVCASGTDLGVGQPVRFNLLTDERQKQSVAASGASSSQHAVHAYMRATDVTPIRQDDMASLSRDALQALVLLETLSSVFDDNGTS